ncbi:MAG: hypothetical protein KKH98_11635, partial [Spirochaetes bacterium]|nr:hypothetical protein [Spirochaetota bacterium]
MKKLILFLLLLLTVALFLPVTGVNAVRPSKGVGEKDKIIDDFFMQGLKSYIQRDFKGAAESWQKVLELQPTHNRAKIYFEKAFYKYQTMETNFYRGLNHFNKENYKTAIPFFKETLIVNPRHQKAIYYLQLCYDLLKTVLKIVDAPGKEGKDIKKLTITTDDEIVLYAVGFDGIGNYLGPVKVKWATTGTLDEIEKPDPDNKLNFSPATFDTKGSIVATLSKEISAKTGEIIIKRGKLKYVKILDGSDFMGKDVD